jgi:hypothetical protein
MWNDGDIIIPPFQRNFVWSIRQSSLLIESFLLGLPVPQVFFHVDEENKSVVIDGQQRILSVVFFLDGYFGTENIQGRKQVFRLKGLDERSPFANLAYEDLEDAHQRKLRSAVLRAINIRQLNPRGEPTSVYHIFERLNTGGTALKPQEIRNCVFRGRFAEVLQELNRNPDWRTLLGKATFDRHQKDVELVLRVFALRYGLDTYAKPMKEFLNRTMERERNGTSDRVRSFEREFLAAASLLAEKLGPKPFNVRGPLNTSVLDSVMVTALENLDALPKDLRGRFELLVRDQEFRESTFYGTSDEVVVQRRFSRARAILL